jgi:hypothetical protein
VVCQLLIDNFASASRTVADEAGDRIARRLDELAQRMTALEGAGRGAVEHYAPVQLWKRLVSHGTPAWRLSQQALEKGYSAPLL